MDEALRILALGAPAFALLIVIADAFAAPRGPIAPWPRSRPGTIVLLCASTLAYAVVLTATGASLVSAAVIVALTAALSLISNIKRGVLGEPLVFSDFALIGAVFQHPQFYLSALRPLQIFVLGGGMLALAAALVLLSNGELAPRIVGLALAIGSFAGLVIMLRNVRWLNSSDLPDPEAEVLHHGLIASLLVHWHDWRRTPDPPPCALPVLAGEAGQLVVIVQCESFTDPTQVFGGHAAALPALEAARDIAWQHGRLLVSGFGAYTMRTEYGVLFGRGEDQLGTRRFDPFLTARGETGWALPNRLDPAHWDSWFAHPHDMRFYGRDRLMPQAGFTALVGEDAFAPPAAGEGRYVTDSAVADRVLQLAQDSERASLIYTVTIENHGPWPPDEEDPARNASPYLRLLARSDAMLARLMVELPRLGRPVVLCFFGDHRPSIPGASEPGAERHTPYVLLRFAPDGTPVSGTAPDRDLTPAELHHAILDAIRLGETER